MTTAEPEVPVEAPVAKPQLSEAPIPLAEKPEKPSPWKWPLIVIGGIAVLAIVVGWWLYSRTYEDTDDAQIDAHLNPVSSRVGGTVRAVYVEDNQRVTAGQPLADLDEQDLRVQLARAQADYDQALGQLAAENPNLPITRSVNDRDLQSGAADVVNAEAALDAAKHDHESSLAKLRQAEAANIKAQADVARYRQLYEKEEVAHSDYDQYVANARSQQAAVESAAASVSSAREMIGQRSAQLNSQRAKLAETSTNAPRQVLIKQATVASRRASVESAKAQLNQARLNVSYCHIVAPVDGIAIQRSAELGGRISDGQQLFVVVQTAGLWATANFKETQLRKMHPGQKVKISVDALGKDFEGTVESMPASTGDRTSVLPPENATGNYVKVIQRLPVRIKFNPGQPGLELLRPGMSVEPKVYFN